MKLKLIKIQICEACLDGIGDECHTPGCALWLHSVDLPIHKEFYEVLETFDEDTQPRPDIVTKDKVKIHSAMQRDNPKPCMSAGATEAAISEDEELASGDCPECGGKEEVCPVPSHHLYSKIRMKHNNICAACGANLFPCQQCKPDQEV